MTISVNLRSKKKGELNKFLEKYYEEEDIIGDDIGTWIYVYNKPLEAVDLISAVMDNDHNFDISIFIQVDDGYIHPITSENYNGVVKDFYNLFYEEKPTLLYQ